MRADGDRMGPLGGGLLTGRYGTDRSRPNDTRIAATGAHRDQLTESRLAIADAVNTLAAERGASPSQVAIALVRSQQARAVIVPILGARRCSQIEDNVGALDIELTPDERDRLEQLTRIELGFPHDFAASSRLVDGDNGSLIDDRSVAWATGVNDRPRRPRRRIDV